MAPSSFRSASFDPVQLAAQIVAMQCSYYICLSAIVLVLDILTGAPVTLSHVLVSTELDPSTTVGWSLFFAFMAASLATCFLAALIVERSKLCLDFAVTLHMFHLVFVVLYSGQLPTSLFWWLTFGSSTAIVAFGGEQLCMRRELEPIMLSGGGRRRRNDLSADSIELEKLDPANNSIGA
nr:hypothetical protein HK105_004125 [Polyrhizophydium stewartii]